MIDEELMNKFDRIQDLPVSEEMLGAYLEGNLSPIEAFDVELVIQEYDYLRDVLSSNNELESDSYDISIDSTLSDFTLPLIPDDSFIEFDLGKFSLPELEYFDYAAAYDIDDQYSYDDSCGGDIIDNPFEDDEISFDSSDDNDIFDYE